MVDGVPPPPPANNAARPNAPLPADVAQARPQGGQTGAPQTAIPNQALNQPPQIRVSAEQAAQIAQQLSTNPQTFLPRAAEIVELRPLPPALTQQVTLTQPQQPVQNAALQQTLQLASALLNLNLNAPSTPSPLENLITILNQQQALPPPASALTQNITTQSNQFSQTTPNIQLLNIQSTESGGQGSQIPLTASQSESLRSFSAPAANNITLNTTSLLQSSTFTLPQSFSAQINQVNLPAPQIVQTAAENVQTNQTQQTAQASQQSTHITQSNLSAGQLNATLQGATPNALPVIGFEGISASALYVLSGEQESALQTFSRALPEGTQIQLTPQVGSSQSATLNQATGPIPLLAGLSASTNPFAPGAWPIMYEVQQALLQSVPQAAQAMSNVTPSPAAQPTQFGAAVMFFVSAVRSGDVQSWLGDRALDVLRTAGRGDLGARAGQEAGLLGRLIGSEQTNPGQDWRGIALPVMHEDEIQKMMLHYRNEDSEGEGAEAGKSKQTRFIFDLSLDRMGPVQLDGLFRPGAGPEQSDGRLDVILRTEELFSEASRQKMRQLYFEALKQTNVTGELSFQFTPEQWVKINSKPDSSEHYAGDV